MICRWKEIFVAIFDANFSVEVDRHQAAHLVEDIQKLCGRHVVVIRVSRDPKLHNGLLPLVQLSAAIDCIEPGRF